MEEIKNKKGKKAKKIILSVIAVLLALIVIVFAVCMIPLKTHEISPSVFESDDGITVTEVSGSVTAFIPENPEAGLIFYQGARVDAKAYAPLMRALAERNILAVVIDTPFNLAFFKMNAPDGIQEKFPQVKKWYLGGHSMGAEVAGQYLTKHADDYEGLVLFAGFTTSDLSSTNLKVISVYGSNDGVLTGGAYDECLNNLPDNFTEHIIDGGNHSGIAYYGPQKGDNEASISKDEQIKLTADFVAKEMKSEG